MAETTQPASGSEQPPPDWRELIKPLFMEMQRRGIHSITVVRDGSKCRLQMTMDIDQPDASDEDDEDLDDDLNDDDEDYWLGDREGPLDYLEKTANE